MALGMEVCLSPGDFVLDEDPDPLPKKGAEPPPQFSVHFDCGQTAGCIKMPLGMEEGFSPGDFVLHGDPPSPQKGDGAPKFLAHVYYSYCDFVFVRTLHSRYWFVQVQVLILYAFNCFRKSLIVLSLLQYKY